MTSKKPRILVVEDDADSFNWMRRRLSRYGYNVEWAATVADGMGKLQARPCVVVLDLSMPDGCGTTILREIRDRALPIKVAVVSGVGPGAMHDEARQLQPDEFFQKPVDAIQLISWLKSVCP
jgi:DNA-binding NtrC family response regulator